MSTKKSREYLFLNIMFKIIFNIRVRGRKPTSFLLTSFIVSLCFPSGLGGKVSAFNAEDPDLIPGSGKSLGEGNGNLLQYSCLEIPMDRGACQATVHGVTKSLMWLSNYHFHCVIGMHLKRNYLFIFYTKNSLYWGIPINNTVIVSGE